MESVGLHSQATPAPTGPRPEWGPADPLRLRGGRRELGRTLGRAGFPAALVLLAGAATAQVPTRAAETPDAGPPGLVIVEADVEAVTLRAHEVKLDDLLREVASRTGLVVEVEGPLDGRVSLEVERLPLRHALDRILRDHGFVLRHRSPPSRPGDSGEPGRVWIYPRAAREAHAGGRRVVLDPPCDDDGSGARAGGPCLLTRLAAAGGPQVRRRAVSDLARAGGHGAAAALAAAALFDTDASVRREAVYGLTEIDDETAAVETLERALLDPELRVRKAAVDALTDIGGDAASWALAAALDDRDLFVRERAVHALGEIGGDTALLLVQSALGDEHPRVRQAATEVLDEDL